MPGLFPELQLIRMMPDASQLVSIRELFEFI